MRPRQCRNHWLHLPQVRGSYRGTRPQGQTRRAGREGNKMVQSSKTVAFFFRQDLEQKKERETTRRAAKGRPREVHGQEECSTEQGELCFPLEAHLGSCITQSQLKCCRHICICNYLQTQIHSFLISSTDVSSLCYVKLPLSPVITSCFQVQTQHCKFLRHILKPQYQFRGSRKQRVHSYVPVNQQIKMILSWRHPYSFTTVAFAKINSFSFSRRNSFCKE